MAFLQGTPDPVGSIERTNLDPAFARQMRGAMGEATSLTSALQGHANQAAGSMQTNFGGFAPNINSSFGQYNPQLQTNFAANPQIDARTQSVLSLAEQQRGQALGAQQRQIGQQFGNNRGLASVLQQQAANSSKLSANPMLFQATEAQAARNMQEAQAGNAAMLQQAQQGAATQQMGNNAQLQRSAAGVDLANAGNSALAQRFQMQTQPLAAQQNLLATLSSLGQLFGSREINPQKAQGPTMAGYQATGNINPFTGQPIQQYNPNIPNPYYVDPRKPQGY